MTPTPAAGPVQRSAHRAEALAARLPALLVAAQRVAATVAQGVHGRRRPGAGDAFWQFRPFLQGDPTTRIDWRQSAKADRAFVREREWATAQSVYLWRDASASMRWSSALAAEEKRARAELLLLALAALLLRGGERVRLLGAEMPALSGQAGLEHLAEALLAEPDGGSGLPPDAVVIRHSRVVLIGDFLAPLEEIAASIGRLAAVPASGHVLQVLDPAEIDLPYHGRVRFLGLEAEAETLVPRVEHVRAEYDRRLAAQIRGLGEVCTGAGFSASLHRTADSPETALLSLYMALAA